MSDCDFGDGSASHLYDPCPRSYCETCSCAFFSGHCHEIYPAKVNESASGGDPLERGRCTTSDRNLWLRLAPSSCASPLPSPSQFATMHRLPPRAQLRAFVRYLRTQLRYDYNVREAEETSTFLRPAALATPRQVGRCLLLPSTSSTISQ